MKIVNAWERWLDTLDSSGGHIALLFMLLIVGVVMEQFGMAKGEDVQMGAFGGLLMTLKTAHSNFARHQPEAPKPETQEPAR